VDTLADLLCSGGSGSPSGTCKGGCMRHRFFWILNRTLNRLTTRAARGRRGPFSLVRHVGRRSGKQYETPVILARVPEGFVAELTYGPDVDWYKNVTAAGHCTVLHHGLEYEVDNVVPYPAELGRAAFPAPARLVLRTLGRKDFRLLTVSSVA
jgi:deazaflavin-dependent oxidoreductase (nitroreductase family)